MSCCNRRLCMLNQYVSMCDLLLPTGFKGPIVGASQRCDSVLIVSFVVIATLSFYSNSYKWSTLNKV